MLGRLLLLLFGAWWPFLHIFDGVVWFRDCRIMDLNRYIAMNGCIYWQRTADRNVKKAR